MIFSFYQLCFVLYTSVLYFLSCNYCMMCTVTPFITASKFFVIHVFSTKTLASFFSSRKCASSRKPIRAIAFVTAIWIHYKYVTIATSVLCNKCVHASSMQQHHARACAWQRTEKKRWLKGPYNYRGPHGTPLSTAFVCCCYIIVVGLPWRSFSFGWYYLGVNYII